MNIRTKKNVRLKRKYRLSAKGRQAIIRALKKRRNKKTYPKRYRTKIV